MKETKIKEIISQLTLEEKAGLCSGRDNWFTKGVERLGIPAIRMSDGPHGLRTQSGEMNGFASNSIPAVCFPSACAMASSFDRELLQREGEILGSECQASDVQVILGPGVNIKRSPLCGRNFEYYSEDPLIATEMATAFIQGVQSQGVGTSLKHFLANNQEHRRMTNSSEVDERTLREIYLAAFEGAVKNAQPWTVMASYNKINGTFSTENSDYLQEILRKEWGFKGLVVSDWGATHNRVAAVAAGTDLTMPAEIETDIELIKAVENGTLDESVLDIACENILMMTFMGVENSKPNTEFDYEGGHEFAREAAGQSMVLLKNEDSILPLKRSGKIAFIGKFASEPRYQGSGSSYINSFKVTSSLDAAADAGITLDYAEGYSIKEDKTDDTLLAEAVATAQNADVAVIFAGLTEQMESEGFDRKHMNMPTCQNELIEAVCAVQPNTVVVLHNGAPIEMPWVDKPKAILETYLGGQAVGAATVDVLFGDVNPSGRLAESFPKRLEVNPSYLFYFGEGNRVEYNEKVFVGYRYYESKKMETLFPFGYGLSYTTFEYSNLKLNKSEMTDDDTLTVSVDVTNTGRVVGKEVVQLYVAPEKGEIIRPVRELKGFDKISLQPGETKTVTFQLSKRAFAYWNIEAHDWYVESGRHAIQIGKSSHDIVCEEIVDIAAKSFTGNKEYNITSTIGEIIQHPLGKKFWEENLGKFISGLIANGMVKQEQMDAIGMQPGDEINDEIIKKFSGNSEGQETSFGGMEVMMSLPVTILLGFIPDLSKQDLNSLFGVMNQKM
jgi:beta-glucosidase